MPAGGEHCATSEGLVGWLFIKPTSRVKFCSLQEIILRSPVFDFGALGGPARRGSGCAGLACFLGGRTEGLRAGGLHRTVLQTGAVGFGGVFLLSLADSQPAPLCECAVPSGQQTGSHPPADTRSQLWVLCLLCCASSSGPAPDAQVPAGLRPPVSARAAHGASPEPALSPQEVIPAE